MILIVRDARERETEREFACREFHKGNSRGLSLEENHRWAITVAEQLLVIAE
jgi:hypothetical protein